ncbi:MAG: class I SAM-dependent methyltransferase [Lewinellaceae bacterium]|nr:class I SAM-dependent methyltransferase [Lewinellaceae bacterium]
MENIPREIHPLKILDIGCGNGANARVLKIRYPGVIIDGITLSLAEKKACEDTLNTCWVHNIEDGLSSIIGSGRYDMILLSHVLEHLKAPSETLRHLSDFLIPGGLIVLAVPNILYWPQRINFLLGNFTYTETGLMDKTHLRFFTYRNIDEVLALNNLPLKKKIKLGDAKFPMWRLRALPFFAPVRNALDHFAQLWFPNLMSWQILVVLEK